VGLPVKSHKHKHKHLDIEAECKVYLGGVDAELLQIGELAQWYGVSTATLRYYERLGLLASGVRTESGYRLYGVEEQDRLRFILRAKALGLTLDEIGALLDVWEQGSCATTREQLRHVVAHKVALARRQAQEAEIFAAQLVCVYERLGEDEDSGAEQCSCIPEMPIAPSEALASELVRVEASACSCDGKCATGCRCGCECCSTVVGMTQAGQAGRNGEGGDYRNDDSSRGGPSHVEGVRFIV